MRKAGLSTSIGMHVLRHTYTSTLIADGRCSPLTLQLRLGHSSIEETYGTYGHLFNEDAVVISQAVESLLSPPAEATSLLTSAGAARRAPAA